MAPPVLRDAERLAALLVLSISGSAAPGCAAASPHEPAHRAPAQESVPAAAPLGPSSAARDTAAPDRTPGPTALAGYPGALAAAGLWFFSEGARLHVSDGRVQTELDAGFVTDVLAAESAPSEQAVTLTYQDDATCRQSDQPERQTLVLSVSTLRAELATQDALAELRGGRVEAATALLTRAVDLDPKLEPARVHLARALSRSHRKREAVRVLAPLLAAKPLRAYHALTLYPELAPLLEAAEVRALRAPRPGAARIGIELAPNSGGHGIGGTGLSVSPVQGWVAVVRTETSWGTPAWEADLVVFDAGAGQERLRVPLVGFRDTMDPEETARIQPAARAEVDRRVGAANRLLADLGFSADAGARSARILGRAGRAPIPGTLWTFELDDTEVRLLRGRQRIATHPALGIVAGVATYLPSVAAVVVEMSHDRPEGCFQGPESTVAVIRGSKP